jgi:hypothetical protein
VVNGSIRSYPSSVIRVRKRSVDKKKALHKKVAELLSEKPAVRPEALIINLVEVVKAN